MASITPAPAGFYITQEGSSPSRWTVIGLTIMHDEEYEGETVHVVAFDHEDGNIHEISTFAHEDHGFKLHLDQ